MIKYYLWIIKHLVFIYVPYNWIKIKIVFPKPEYGFYSWKQIKFIHQELLKEKKYE